MDIHLKVLGWFHVVLGVVVSCVCLPTGLAMLWIRQQAGPMVVPLGDSADETGAVTFDLFGRMAFVLLFVAGIVGVAGFIAGVAILRRARWGRVLGIVFSIACIVAVIPVHVALGIYGLVILLDRRSAALFRCPGRGGAGLESDVGASVI